MKTYKHVQAYIRIPLLKPVVCYMNVIPLDYYKYFEQQALKAGWVK